jgi:hypothetical protein
MPLLSCCCHCKTIYDAQEGDGISHGYCEPCAAYINSRIDVGEWPTREEMLRYIGIPDVSYRMIGAVTGPGCQRSER